MAEWRTMAVGDCLIPMKLGAIKKLQTKEYKQKGKIPIVDQGQSLIAGWTDDESGLIEEGLPLVVFGDHTRSFKFVDFPFVRGADGTQVLKANTDIDPLFFYYALLGIDLPSRGYNRHFKALKEKSIGIPNPEEQIAIARILKLVDDAKKVQAEQLEAWQRCKKLAMSSLFTRGLRGEAQKESEIGPVPESWEVHPLETHFSVVSGGTPSRKNSLFWDGGDIPWVKTTEVDYCVIERTEEHITQNGLTGSAAKLLPAGTILLAMYGQGVTRGKVAILGIDATCNQACAAIRRKTEAVLPRFLYHFLTHRYDEIRQLAHGGNQQNLNLDIVRSLSLACPGEKSEQEQIVGLLDAVDKRIALLQRKNSVLHELFDSLLHELMNEEVSAFDLDLSVFGKPKKEEAA